MARDQNDLKLAEIESENVDLEIDQAPYEIRTYGTDLTIELYSKKIEDKEIVVPDWQRRYVWGKKQASRLIESFLLGLPVPEVFLFRRGADQQLQVVDGQQRLMSIYFFFHEKFNDASVFELQGVKSKWEGKTYQTLDEGDRRKLKNSILRATVFEQVNPNDDTSIFHIFERLNTGGTALNAQEIRNCVVSGPINSFLEHLNRYENWRKLLGKPQPDRRMKDIEMIVRFFALYFEHKKYRKPMTDFLTSFMRENADLPEDKKAKWEQIFTQTIDAIFRELGKQAFRVTGVINVAAFDSISVTVAKRGPMKISNLRANMTNLFKDKKYLEAISSATTDADRVQRRIELAMEYLSK